MVRVQSTGRVFVPSRLGTASGVAPGRHLGFHALVRRFAAHAVTLLRPALAPCFAAAVVAAERGASGWIAAALFAVVAGSDALDGRLARRLGTASSIGRVLDHGADIVFLLVALSSYVWIGAAPWWVPVSIGASFAAYAVDSRWRPDVQPRWMANRIGHAGGVANYVLIGVLVGNHSVGLGWLPPSLMLALFVAVPIYSGIAIGGRLAARRSALEQDPPS